MKQKLTYSDKLKDPRWQKKRLEILERDSWKCTLCGDHETSLHVHHNSYSGNPWEAESDQLTTLCEHCHSLISSDAFKAFYAVPKSVLKRVRNEKGFIFYVVKTVENDIGLFLFHIEANVYEYCIGIKEVLFNEVLTFYKS